MTISGFPRVDSTVPDLGSPQVNPVTGSVALRVLDYGQRDLGETFLLERAYVSGRIKDDNGKKQSLGCRWTLDFDGKLTRDGANLRLPIGAFRWEAFCYHGKQWVHGKDAGRYQLREKRDGFVLRDFRTPAEFLYNEKGYLISIQKRGGLSRKIHYYGDFPVGITLSSGKKISLEYEGSCLVAARDELGRMLSYQYGDGLLRKVVYPNHAGIQYDYDEMKRLISGTDRNGKQRFQMDYDFYGRVAHLNLSSGERYTYRYADQDRRMILLEENSLEFRTYYWNYRNQVTRITLEDGSEERFEYDGAGRVVFQRDASGKELRRTYDGRGMVMGETYSDGLSIDYGYDALGRLTRVHDNFDGEEQYTWNEQGWLVEKRTRLTGHAWRTERWERDMVGRILAYSRNGNRIGYGYTGGTAPLPHLMEMPGGGKFSYTYDAASRLLQIKSERGERNFSYNTLDLLARDTDALGYQQEYAYDLQGEPMDGKQVPRQGFPGSRDETAGVVPQHGGYEGNPEFLCSYDAKGRITEVLRADDKSLAARFSYDIGGRVIESRTAGEGEKERLSFWLRRWRYDNNDNVVEERQWMDPQDESSTRGRIYILRYEYDSQDRMVGREDNKGVRDEYAYDSLNCCVMWKVRRKDRPVEVTRYLYDAMGRLIGSDEKSDHARTGRLWDHTAFTLGEDGACLRAVFPEGREETGEGAETAYRECLARIPHYGDASGYCRDDRLKIETCEKIGYEVR